ncbi:potassium channel tetramerization domain containing 13 [Homo sapiens]|uniref:Potassium channel tetramerization domain containing 13 n=1 Tax=Homo sapiens TaxID=9606 RepID=I3L108_HUMAN|nr:potassium channel tetramerization domain containing 13 [Homo sapiens]KAI4054431.1 potassium channel tetramerization domain containing 13 [Homo sapiens]
MSAEASGPAAAAAPSLEAPKPSGLEPGPAAYGLKPLTPNSKYVKLNVGGSLHYTTLRTLTGQDTMLKAMFSGRVEVLTDAGGWVLIDRSGRHFGTILNYLRDGSVPLPESTRELGELLGEARYYLVQGLIEDCQLALQVRAFGVPMPMFLGELPKQVLEQKKGDMGYGLESLALAGHNPREFEVPSSASLPPQAAPPPQPHARTFAMVK